MKPTSLKTCFAVVAFAALVAGDASAQAQGLRRQGLFNRNRPGLQQRTQSQQQQPAVASDTAEAAATTREDLKNVPRGTNGVPALAFNQAPLDLVLDAYAEQVQKTILPAPDLPKATITLNSLEGQTLTKEEYLEAIEAVLTMNGVVLEPRGEKFLRALTRKTVRTQGIPIRMDVPSSALPEKSRVVSQMITLRNVEVAEAQKALEGFKDPNGLFQVFERTNAILVTDTQENINRMLEIVKAIDIATPVMEDVFVRQIKFAVANDIKTALETIVTESQKEQPKESVGTKSSGAPGFTRNQPPQSTLGARLLNLGNRPGQNQPPPVTPNETLLAAVSDADRGMIRGKVLILADERSNKLIIITSKANMDFFDRVIETLDVETDPEFKVEVRRLRYAEAEDVASMLNDLIGGTSLSSSSKSSQNQTSKNATNTKQNIGTQRGAPGAKPAAGGSNRNATSVGDLNKDNCKVLADKRINGIVVMTRTELMPVVMAVIERMDIKLSQVLIETVIVEVSLGDDITTGIDWIQRGKYTVSERVQRTDEFGRELFYAQDKDGNLLKDMLVPAGYSRTDEDGNATTASSIAAMKTVYKTVRDGLLNRGDPENSRGYALGGGGGKAILAGSSSSTSSSSGSSADGDSTATDIASGALSVIPNFNPSGAGINYFLKSDKLNLAAVIQAAKSDSRSKYLASPIVMTVDNKEATIEATQMRYLLTGYTYSGNTYSGSTVPNYEQKQIGLTIKITPKINPDGTVMLNVEEEYSQVGPNQAIQSNVGGDTISTVSVPTTITRKMSADVLLDNMQTVVLGGLTETSTSSLDTGIPILKDIPWVGKYLFGYTESSEARKELLVFMTPYVLDDAAEAQAEALRRKKAMSDPRPWEDNGWSSSALADPVARREMLRRFQDEWAKQDEERKTKLAIEKAKIDRAKKLEKMTEREREFWLELHKDELEREEKEAFEKKVKEQSDLKSIVEGIKERKMEKTEAALKEAEKETASGTARAANPAVKRAEEKKAAYRAAHPEEVKKSSVLDSVTVPKKEAAKPVVKPPATPSTPEPLAPKVPAAPEKPGAPKSDAVAPGKEVQAKGGLLGDLAR